MLFTHRPPQVQTTLDKTCKSSLNGCSIRLMCTVKDHDTSASSSVSAELQADSEPCCANCGYSAPEQYCPRCGQETRAPPTILEFLREVLDHLLSFESKALRTLAKLHFRPGKLTSEYFAGRRVRYVRPLRLYLRVSVLVVASTETLDLQLGLRFVGSNGIYLFETGEESHPGNARADGKELRPMEFILEHLDTPGVQRFKALSVEEKRGFVQARRHTYRAVVLSQPGPKVHRPSGVQSAHTVLPQSVPATFCASALALLNEACARK
jgi:Protein of unknown function (DUF3667)